MGSRGVIHKQQMFHGASYNHRDLTLPVYHLLLAGKRPFFVLHLIFVYQSALEHVVRYYLFRFGLHGSPCFSVHILSMLTQTSS